MTLEELQDIIQAGEDSKTQFKRMFTSPDALAAEIGAFANSEGGRIIVGVDDNGDIVGISKEDVTRLNQMISNVCVQKIDPAINVTTENIRYKDKVVVVIKVPIGPNKFYMSNGTDIWVKVGADKRRAKREELKRLLQESSQLFADEQIVDGTSIEDLDIYMIRNFVEKRFGKTLDEVEIPIEKLLTNLKIMKDGKCTLGGLLLFGWKSSLIWEQYSISAVSFYGNDISGTEYKESEDIYGNVRKQFVDGIAFIKRQLRKVQGNQKFNSVGILEIPEIALEEALINAIVHRNYFINSKIRIFVLDDRVEIINPGTLPNTLTVDSISAGIHIARNPVILSHIKEIPDIPYRGIGTGIRRIINECEKAGIKVEFFNQIEVGQFKVVFWRDLI